MFLKSKFLGVALATCVALGVSACGNDGSGASVKEPIINIETQMDRNYDVRYVLVIQSQDNDTMIEDIVINRGNCPVKKYDFDSDKLKAYEQANPDRVLLQGGAHLVTKNGNPVDIKRNSLYSRKADMDFYNSLDTKSQSIYAAIYPKQLAFAQKFTPLYLCSGKNILEIELVINGKKITYDMSIGRGFTK